LTLVDQLKSVQTPLRGSTIYNVTRRQRPATDETFFISIPCHLRRLGLALRPLARPFLGPVGGGRTKA